MAQPHVVKALANSLLLRDLPPETLERVAGGARSRGYRRGEVVFHQGDAGNTLYVLESGRVKVEVDAESGDRAVVAILGPGDCFGEMALIDGQPRSATVEALEPVEALVLARPDFMEVVRTSTEAMECLLLTMTARMRHITQVVADLTFLDLEGRLAKKLLELAEEHGREVEGAVEIELPITQEDLAAMIGTTRATVNRLLGNLEDRRAIERRGRRILVRDAERLRRRIT